MSEQGIFIQSPNILFLRALAIGKRFSEFTERYEKGEIKKRGLPWEDTIFLNLTKKPLKEGYDKSKSGPYRLGFSHGCIRTVYFILEGKEFLNFLKILAGDDNNSVTEIQETIKIQRLAFEQKNAQIVEITQDERLINEYQEGYGRGQSAIINYKGLLKKPESTTIPYVIMLLLRKELNRAPSVEYVHEQLTRHYPEIFKYKIESFKVLCSRINFSGRNYQEKN